MLGFGSGVWLERSGEKGFSGVVKFEDIVIQLIAPRDTSTENENVLLSKTTNNDHDVKSLQNIVYIRLQGAYFPVQSSFREPLGGLTYLSDFEDITAERS